MTLFFLLGHSTIGLIENAVLVPISNLRNVLFHPIDAWSGDGIKIFNSQHSRPDAPLPHRGSRKSCDSRSHHGRAGPVSHPCSCF